MWQWLLECLLYLVNLITILGLSWHALQQSEQIKRLREQILDLANENDDLRVECNHQSQVSWNRLTDEEKDASIRMI